MLGRLLAILLSLPLFGAGFAGLYVNLQGEDKQQAARKALLERLPEDSRKGAKPVVGLLASRTGHGALLILAVGLLGYGGWPRGGGAKRSKAPGPKGRKANALAPTDAGLPVAASGRSKKEAKRVLRMAKAMEAEHGPEAAGDFLFDEGLADEAAALFERAGLLTRLAEVFHDQNRFDEAAATWERCENWEHAGSIYQQLERFEDAARCYVKAGKCSVAGEMYERAENYHEAGKCYRDIGFHRHAAQSFLKGNCELEAAQSLVAAFDDEGGGKAATNEQAAREQRGLAKKAGDLFLKLEHFEEAESVYVRSGAYGSAGKVAFHVGAYERAAEMFTRVGRGDLAAQALQKLDREIDAARVLGHYLREKDQLEEAVAQLEKAEEYQEAGDLYRRLERFENAGDCYTKVADHSAAAEMYRAAGMLAKAGEAYEKTGHFEQAAGCMGEAGEWLRQAQLMEKAGDHFGAGKAYQEHGQIDDAIRVLQLVDPGEPCFADSCAVLGGLFEQKGMLSLSVKKFEEATAEQPVTRENVAAYFQLAQAYERREEFAGAAEIYEKILAFDYHYSDVGERLERAKQARAAQPPTGVEAAAQQTAGRYEVQREIGRGGMGVVYLARDTVLDRAVAFKVLPEQLRENLNALKNFLREAKAAAQLNHPNIVTVYDAGESEHGFYLAMELVEGTTLKEIVQRRGAVSSGGVIYILRQMAEALAYAHGRKVVHRDIKTANTMWTPSRQVKVMDFGLARLMEEVRNATTVVSGTPFYMSPEQTLGRNIDHRTDLYSLGVTLFELATGELPFRKGNVPYHHVHTAPPTPRSINDKVPEALERVILRLMEKAPEDRYQSAKELAEEAAQLEASPSNG